MAIKFSVKGEGRFAAFSVAASHSVTQGDLVVMSASNYAAKYEPATAGREYLSSLGVCAEDCDNSTGAAGDKKVKVWTHSTRVKYPKASLSTADSGKTVYLSASAGAGQFALSGASMGIANLYAGGRVEQVDGSDVVVILTTPNKAGV